MRWLITVWLVAMASLLWIAGHPETLTLDDPGNWTPPAVLDTSQVEPPPEPDLSECVAVDAMALPELAVADLVAVGWFGDPLDGAEWLYSPGCD